LRFRLQAGDPQGSLILPSSEKDLLVRAYFNFQCGKPGPQTAGLRYAYDCNKDNDRLLVGSRIKAWTVAGFTTEEIAQRLHTSPDRVRVYQGLFFEVREYQTDRFAMGAILSPLLLPDSLVPPQERQWLLAALKIGREGVDFAMGLTKTLTPTDAKKMDDGLRSILAEQSLTYTLSFQLEGKPGKTAFQHFEKLDEERRRYPPWVEGMQKDTGLYRLILERRRVIAAQAAAATKTRRAKKRPPRRLW
jgi:hypothetical protein